MKYHALSLQPMQESGKSLLRAMQNESMMPLDLLVREAVQNSMDAASEGTGGEVRVDFLIRSHATETISSVLADGINSATLRKRFPAGGQMLEIRDTLTEGLSGPLSLDDVSPGEPHGNLLKLVYEIGRTRDDEGAGGSWGLGKTCYFRIGAGLVFYYSRIKEGNEYPERLVACLVEDESKEECLQTSTATGIAWWGAEGLRPLTRSTQIRKILDQMGIKPFGSEETGTAVIIPFLRADLIPSPQRINDDEETQPEQPVAWWYANYEEYLRVAVQRWFSARLDNNFFRSGPRLTVSVNREVIRRQDMLPVFQVAQALYNRTRGDAPQADDYLQRNGVQADSIICDDVTLRKIFQSSGMAGQISAVLISAAQLQMDAPENRPDPYLCLFGHTETKPPYRPLVTFMRSPGMSIQWNDSTEARAWSGGLSGPADGRFLIAVFVPAPGQKLISSLISRPGPKPVTLESYLRSCERADHHQWSDIAGFDIADKIRRGVGKRLKEFGSIPVSTNVQSTAIRMARSLADLLLPQRGLGTDGRSGRSSPRAKSTRADPAFGRKGKGSGVSFEITHTEYRSNGIRLGWSLSWGKEAGPREITLSVDSENGPISYSEWTRSGLGAFPFSLAEIKMSGDKGDVPCSFSPTTLTGGSKLLISPSSKVAENMMIRGEFEIIFSDHSAKQLRPLLNAAAIPNWEVPE